MSDLDEPRTRCPNCGKNAPAMKYCIYCGAQLPPITLAPDKTILTPSKPPPTLPTEVPAPTARPVIPQVSVVPAPVALENDVNSLMTSISSLYERKIALLGLFQSGEVAEGTFQKLFSEYGNKLNEILNSRIRKMGELRSRMDDRSRRLTEVSLSLEELGVRHKIGEIDLNTYAQRAEKLRIEERELREAVKNLKANNDRLSRIFAEKKPSEVHNLEMQLKSHRDTLETKFKDGKISVETWNTVKPDIDEMLVFFDSLTGNRKEEERRIKEQLDTLQARYKLSEVSLEEYDKRKRELQEEINKVWE